MNRNKSGLFLVELIIAIAFFAITSAVCVQLFAMANTLSVRSVALQMSVMNAQNVAESFKATGGNINKMGYILQADYIGNNVLSLNFDENWQQNSYMNRYILTVNVDINYVPAVAQISIKDTTLGEEIYSLTVNRYLGVH